MKNIGKLAVLGAVLAAAGPLAHATILTGSLTVDGQGTFQDSFTPTSITFTGSPNSKVDGVGGNLSAVATLGDNSTMSSFTSTSTGVTIFTDNTNSSNLQFVETSIASWTESLVTSETLTIQGYGFFKDTVTGDTSASGIFTLTSSTAGCMSTSCSSSNSAAISLGFTPVAFLTPEPNSLLLLGTGLFGAAGMLMRRRRVTA